MNCPICGKPTLMGAKLCGPCRSALKRARDDTVFELPGARAAAADDGPAPARARLPARWIALCTLGLAAFGAAAFHLATRPDNRAETEATRVVTVARDTDSAVVRSATPVLPANAALTTPALDIPPQPQPAHAPEHAAPRARPAPTSMEPLDASPAPAPLAAPLRVPAPAALPPTVSVDPWQAMQAALGRCGSEGLFARLSCEHRVRERYCEGHWGEVTQCPAGVPNDHGQ